MNITFHATIIYFIMNQSIDDKIYFFFFLFRLTIEFVDLEAHMAKNGGQ